MYCLLDMLCFFPEVLGSGAVSGAGFLCPLQGLVLPFSQGAEFLSLQNGKSNSIAVPGKKCVLIIQWLLF